MVTDSKRKGVKHSKLAKPASYERTIGKTSDIPYSVSHILAIIFCIVFAKYSPDV
jgi:hypothetical protein